MSNYSKQWIVVPTLGRAHMIRRPGTVTALWAARIAHVLVVQPHELQAYTRAIQGWEHLTKILPLPRTIHTIGPTRQWIMQMAPQKGKVVMVDDDLSFSTWQGGTGTTQRFTKSTTEEVRAMFADLFTWLGHYTHASAGVRQGANYAVHDALTALSKIDGVPLVYNVRMQRVLGYNVSEFRNSGVSFERVEPLSDFDVTLSLLRLGHGNIVSYRHVHDECTGGFQAPGGCSTWRTMEKLRAAQKQLVKLHPEFVSAYERTYKDRPDRTELRIQWKKAYQSSQP